MNKNIKYIFLVLGLLIFIYLIYDFGPGNILDNLKKTGWYFFPIIGVWVFIYLFNAVAWSYIINNEKLSFAKILSVTITGYAINYMTPFFHLGGEPYRVMALKPDLGMKHSISAVVSYLMMHFLSSFLFWILACIAIYIYLPISYGFQIVLGICLIVFVAVSFLFITGYKNGVTKSVIFFLVKLPLLKKFSGNASDNERYLMDIDENIKELYHNRKMTFMAANLFELLARLISSLEFYFILMAIGYTPTLLDSFLINAGATLITNILFIVPFELGVREGGLYFVLGLLNYLPSIGIYVSLVNRIRELFWILLGLTLIALSGRNVKEKFERILKDESDAF